MPGPSFRGWRVVAAAFGVMFLGFGCAYSFGAFLGALQSEFAASRGEVSLVFSIAGFLYFSVGIVSGPLADRFGPRRITAIGMLLLGAGMALAGLAESLAGVGIAYSVGVGLGVGFSYVPAVAAVQRWFLRRRGFASGIAVSGIGAGTLLVPPLAAALVAGIGWRGAYIALGLVAGAAGLALAAWVEGDPARHGQLPDGADAGPEAPAMPSGASLGEAVRSIRFAGLYAAGLISSFALFVPFVHLVPYAIDRGADPASAALLISALGAGSTAGRFLLGGIADRLGRGPALVVMLLGMGVALAAWAFLSHLAALTGFGLAFGAFYGGYVALLPALVMDYFGGRNVSAIIGALYTSVGFGTLIGPAAAGFAYDLTGSYTAPILAGAAADLAAALCVLASAWSIRRSGAAGVATGRRTGEGA